MEFLSAQFRQIGEQMRGMSISQRIAIGLLVVVVVGGMWGMIKWGTEPDWIPLLDQSLSAEEVSRVQAELRLAGVSSRVAGDRVQIQGDDEFRQRAQAILSERGALPADTSLAYASLVKQNSVFIGEERSRWMESRGLEAEISGVLRKFDGVRDARVLITVPQKRGFSRQEAVSSASVALTMADSSGLDKQRILAISNFVAGAVPGLQLANIKITDGQRFYRPPEGADQIPTEILEQQQRVEDHYMQKIYDQLRHIEGVVVNVHAKLRTATQKSQKEEYGVPVVQRESATTEEMTGGSRAAEPAVRPNTRVGLTDGQSGSNSTKEQSETTYSEKRDVKMTVVDELRGSVERLSASVSVPRSFLERVAASQGVELGQANNAAIEKISQAELPRIKALVKPLIDAQADDQVAVDWYSDLPATTQTQAAAAASDGLMAMAKENGVKAMLGLLAVVSLVFMLRIAKKAQAGLVPPIALATAGARSGGGASFTVGEDGPLETLSGGSMAVGEVQEMQGVLVGHEVDEETVRTQQIVKQIGQLVKDDATVAAGVVQQWMGESN